MPWVRFEPTMPAFERGKTVHALPRATTVMGNKQWWLVANLKTEDSILMSETDTNHAYENELEVSGHKIKET
jgi:hypothetical protein